MILSVDTEANLAALTIEGLRAEARRLGELVAECQRQRGVAFALVEKRRAEAAARARVAELTPVQRDALLAVLKEG